MKKGDIKSSEGTTSKSRRRLLTALTAGGAAVVTAPTEWTKPALKSVIMPAHAQTSPVADGGDCDYRAINAWALGSSFCMSVSVHADEECGSSARVEVRNGSGTLLVTCERVTSAPFGNGLVSWSCCGNTTQSVNNGSLVTFDVEFSNGCTCREVVTAL